MTEHIAPVRAVITLTCPNAVGLSFEVDSVIADRGWNLTSSQQFVDPESHSFFMRSEVEHMDGEAALADIAIALQKLNAHLGTNIEIPRPAEDASARGAGGPLQGCTSVPAGVLAGGKANGATAHYVTTDLDEGPIIEQEVTRVDHQLGPTELAAIGQDTECIALGRVVTWHLEDRVFRNGLRTVVFR